MFKKISTLFLLFFAVILGMQAQEMSVKSFEYLVSDLTARTNRRNDINDNPAAVIRVGIALQGVVFEGNVLGEPVYNTGEYLVYMSAGSRKLTVRHPNFLPLVVTFADYEINQLEGLCTYKLTIRTSAPNPPTPQPAGNYFVLNVKPTSARVSIDDQEPIMVNADGTIKFFLTNGSHNVKVEAEGYLTRSGTVNMNGTRQQMDITLVSSKPTLIVKTATAGAQIYINEELKGTDQWQGPLAPGTYMVEARKLGYRSSSLTVRVNKMQTETVMVPPLEEAYGALLVDIEPVDAEIYFDGNLLGKAPYLFTEVPIGKHRVRISKPGYVDRLDSVVIEENKQTKISGSLLHGDGTLVPITVNGVTFCMVKVDGGRLGKVNDFNNPNAMSAKRDSVLSFLIAETEVTQALWKAVMGRNPSFFKGNNLPVENVSWSDCQAFIKKLNRLTGMNFRLPTQAEWEFAARGGRRSTNTEYSGSDNLDEVAWHKGNSNAKSHPVKSKVPNELGLYDMTGNVWEWCEDEEVIYEGSYSGSAAQTGETKRVNRGGSWENISRHCRISYHSSDSPNGRFYNLGFRLALDE